MRYINKYTSVVTTIELVVHIKVFQYDFGKSISTMNILQVKICVVQMVQMVVCITNVYIIRSKRGLKLIHT